MFKFIVMGKSLIIKGADFSENGVSLAFNPDFKYGGFEADGSYNVTFDRARTNNPTDTLSNQITADTKIYNTDTSHYLLAYSIRNVDNTSFSTIGLTAWLNSEEINIGAEPTFVGKYIVIAAKKIDGTNFTNEQLADLKSKVVLQL